MTSFRRFWNSLARRRKSQSASGNSGPQTIPRPASPPQQSEAEAALKGLEPPKWVPQFGRAGRNPDPLFPDCAETPSTMFRKSVVMRGHRRCAPCLMNLSAPTQEQANAMYDQHTQESHPEVAQVSLLIERVDKLVTLLEGEAQQ